MVNELILLGCVLALALVVVCQMMLNANVQRKLNTANSIIRLLTIQAHWRQRRERGDVLPAPVSEAEEEPGRAFLGA